MTKENQGHKCEYNFIPCLLFIAISYLIFISTLLFIYNPLNLKVIFVWRKKLFDWKTNNEEIAISQRNFTGE